VFSSSSSTMLGGSNGTPVYDAGTATATITNNSVTPSVSYTTPAVPWGGSASYSASNLATSLGSAINSAAGSLVTATTSNNSIQLSWLSKIGQGFKWRFCSLGA